MLSARGGREKALKCGYETFFLGISRGTVIVLESSRMVTILS